MNVFQKLFGGIKIAQRFSSWKEFGRFTAKFTPFGKQIYKSDVVRSCIRPLADHTAKAAARTSRPELTRILTYNPNLYMNGTEFLMRCRNLYEAKNNLFIMIHRDVLGRAVGFYPVPYREYEALESPSGELFIKFTTYNNTIVTVAWKDLVVLRKDYLNSDIAGEDNKAIIEQLELIDTTNQGIANAVKATANLRGILKNTKSMLDDEDTKAQRDKFVREYLNLENEGGIASLDATQEFVPITMSPTLANHKQMAEFRENVYRYFGVCEEIITGKASDDVMEAFYSSRIEPFLVDLSIEMTRKVFTEREIGCGNFIEFNASRLQYCSMARKLALVSMVDRGALTPNEWRATLELAPVEGGDVPLRRLDTAAIDEPNSEPIEEVNNEPTE